MFVDPAAVVAHVVIAYGLAWLLTESAVFGWVRRAVAGLPVLDGLLGCIVCTSVWVSAGLAAVAPWLSMPVMPVTGPADLLVLVGCTVTGVLALDRFVGG